jgi:hypothetical protein
MEPTQNRFGGGAADTLLHPLVAMALVLAVILILCLPRKYVVAALLLPIFSIPKGQVVVLAGLHFTIARLLILSGLARWAVSRRSPSLVGGFNSIDRRFSLCMLSLLVIFSLQWMEIQALVKSFGEFVDAIGGYFLLRWLIRDRDDIRRAIRVLALVAVVNAVCMINEQWTGTNFFASLGGMYPEAVRDGKLRSKGVFEVELTAAAFGGTIPLLFVWLWSDGKSRITAGVGLIAITVVAVTCRSTTALSAYGAGILGLCFWPIRKHMRLLRWALVAILVTLHLVMNGPVWSLIEKVDFTGSASSFHRYMLVDNLIRHFSDWWLLGFKNYGNWGWEMWDLSDQYVAYGLTGGLLTLIFFIATLSRSFGDLGDARKLVEADRREAWCLWCLGAALFANVVAYFGIAYFDQTAYSWFALLAVISAAVFESRRLELPRVEDALVPTQQVSVLS